MQQAIAAGLRRLAPGPTILVVLSLEFEEVAYRWAYSWSLSSHWSRLCGNCHVTSTRSSQSAFPEAPRLAMLHAQSPSSSLTVTVAVLGTQADASCSHGPRETKTPLLF